MVTGMIGGLGLHIERIWAYVMVRDDGDEGVVSAVIDGRWMPLIGADWGRVEMLRPHAERVATITGRPVSLVRFDRRIDVDTLTAS